MRSALISAAVLGVVHVSLPAGAAPAGRPIAAGEGADGGRGATLARAGSAGFLADPDTRGAPLMAVGEGGEGGRGRRARRRDGYGYREPYRYRAAPYSYARPPRPYSYAAPPAAYSYAPPPPPYGYPPLPAPHTAPPRSSGGSIWVDPGS